MNLYPSGSTPTAAIYGSSAASAVLDLSQYYSHTADSLRILQSDGSTEVFVVDGSGAIGTAANAAPSDASIVAGQAFIWFDKTNGASQLMIKAKQADGSVKTGSVALS